jgi:hypothetical protein
VLSAGTDRDGRWLVATDLDLLLQRRPPDYSRIGWEVIASASFADDVLSLQLIDGVRYGDTLRIPLAESSPLPSIVRDRVTASVVYQTRVSSGPVRGLIVAARRRGLLGEPVWGYLLDPGVDPGDGETRSRVEALVAQVRGDAGF